jgi:hypothetical protein
LKLGNLTVKVVNKVLAASDDGWVYYSGIEINGVYGLGTSCPLYKISPGTGQRILIDEAYMDCHYINKAGGIGCFVSPASRKATISVLLI